MLFLFRLTLSTLTEGVEKYDPIMQEGLKNCCKSDQLMYRVNLVVAATQGPVPGPVRLHNETERCLIIQVLSPRAPRIRRCFVADTDLLLWITCLTGALTTQRGRHLCDDHACLARALLSKNSQPVAGFECISLVPENCQGCQY